ncbi:MAG: type VI secretion system protein TssR domain-containing protein [Bacteroidota bacterium]
MKAFNMTRFTSLLFLIIGFPSLTLAQLPSGAKAMDTPSKYVVPEDGIDFQPTTSFYQGFAWQVYSDRAGNRTSAQPGGNADKVQLSFLEPLYVYQEQGEYVRVVRDPEFGLGATLMSFTSKAVDCGWIHKRQLLLWNHCLVTPDKSKINKKAMILNTLETLDTKKNKFEDMAAEEVQFLQGPSSKAQKSRSAGLFNVYFIYKVLSTGKETYALLGRDVRAQAGERIGNSINGWVSMSRVVPWDHRVALEPNWDENAATERTSRKKPVQFFATLGSAGAYQQGAAPSAREVLWNDDPGNERNLGEWRRFPVLENQNGIVKVGLMGDINSEHGKIAPELLATIQDKHGEAKKAKRNIDIVFVMDATSSMGEFFPPIANAIKNSIKTLSVKDIAPNKIRFGAVVYRDQAEGTRKTETVRLTENGEEVANFLSKVDARDYKDSDKPEAMFYGLKTAIRGIGMSPEHTNLVILVGDAGNHARSDETQVSVEEVTNLLKSYRCDFMVFQAQNVGNHSTYEDFVSQNKLVMKTMARSIFDETPRNGGGVKVSFPRMVTVGNQTMKIDNGATAATLVYAEPGTKQAPTNLQREVEQIVQVSIRHTDQFLQSVENVVVQGNAVSDVTMALDQTPESQSQYVSAFAPAIMLYLSQTLGLSQEQLKQIAGKNYQLFMPAYAPLQVSGMNKPLFQYVLFLTRKELSTLNRDLSKLVDASNNSEARRAMKDAWISLLEAHIGGVDRSEMEEMSMEEVGDKVFGIPATSSLLANRKLKDLEDRSVVSDAEFRTYVNDIRDKLRDLERIFNANNYKYSFMSNDQAYYWIEQALLP